MIEFSWKFLLLISYNLTGSVNVVTFVNLETPQFFVEHLGGMSIDAFQVST